MYTELAALCPRIADQVTLCTARMMRSRPNCTHFAVIPPGAYREAVRKSIHSPEYEAVLRVLVALRHKAGLTQRDLARALGREHSFVWRIETGERRLDVVEFYWVCQALGQDAREVYNDLVEAFGAAVHAYPVRDSLAKKAAGPPLSYPVTSRAKRRL